MKKILLFVNSKASQAENSFDKISEVLRGLECEVLRGEAKNSADYARVILEKQAQVDVVALAGGDGTLQSAAEVLIKTKIPMGIIPLGTANNVARSLGIPLKINEACEVIAQGKTTDMDVARVNGRVFLSVVGMGMSTLVHEKVPSENKKRWGSLSYAIEAFRMLKDRPPSFQAHIKSSEVNLHVKALQLTVCNGRFYGAHLEVHPEATLTDSLLDLSVIESQKFVRGFIKALMPFASDHKAGGLKQLRSKSFVIETDPQIKIDVEGATDLETPAHFELVPKALKVKVP